MGAAFATTDGPHGLFVAEEQSPATAWAFPWNLLSSLVLSCIFGPWWSQNLRCPFPASSPGSQLPQGALAAHILGPGNLFCSDPRWLL